MSDSPEVKSENISRSSLNERPIRAREVKTGDPQMKLENYAPTLCKRIVNRVNKRTLDR